MRTILLRVLSLLRRPGITRPWLRGVLVANLVGQVLIVFTGGIVRLTGSGLGCPTFPECVSGSYLPVVHQPQGFHKYIEFGNRMLTFVLTALAVAALLAVRRWVRAGNADRRLLIFGAVPFAGVLAQALIGGISVLTKLNPTVVAIHFLVSMALISGSTLLLLVALAAPAAGSPGLEPGSRRPPVLWTRPLAVALAVVTVPVLALGTVVTGAGPHSGDAHDPNRFNFAIHTVARMHSEAVWLFVILLVALLATLRRGDGPEPAQRRALILLALTLAQGVIGYVQYALGVPAALVAAHMLGASLLVVAVTATVYETLTPQPAVLGDQPDQRGDSADERRSASSTR